jgi:hypothetical protein
VTQTHDTHIDTETTGDDVGKPAWRPLALALIASGSPRFADWESDRVVPVAVGSDD